ncbi:ABC transporter permease [Prosthecomicrobium pneumaticum]|uniref:Spermidine/putrescine transport system permease protein n=1 Tax=Prosthecomicrobium pneumaticum TaxID=81895 RepID=A0A7W9FJ45_9HYPH|nr:ABC transporter permease subunit [Prosthecomicrobium pneumaticum]MBB5751196.1 spermidine/putrescine transport system permease protein [Prosthecomicrobium pneumaticum]
MTARPLGDIPPIGLGAAPAATPRRRRPSAGIGGFATFRRAYGGGIAALALLLCAFWLVVMIVLPQAMMLEQSLWSRQSAGDVSLRIDRAYTEIDLLRFDLQAAPAAEKPAMEEKVAALEAEIATLEAQEKEPPKVYGLQNYTRMSGLHFYIFVKTILYALLVTLLSLVVCYPVAYMIAHVAKPAKAAVLLLCLTVPYAINELLRVYAWLMILDYQGVINGFLQTIGLVSFEQKTWIPFLESPAAVFVAMVYAYVLFMVFPILNALQTLDRNQIEAAQDLGASTPRTHWRVIIPHAKPGIAVGCIMTFMLSVGSYSVPQIMTRGLSGDWFSQLVYRQFFVSNDWNVGAAYSFALLIVCIVFIFAVMRLFGVGIRDIAK